MTAAAESLAGLQYWQPVAPYLNTASYGLPPQPAFEELQRALVDWRGGRTSWEHWGDSTERSRKAFARLIGARPEDVAVGATVSELVGLVAAAVPDGSRVLGADGDFASLLFPWTVHARRGVTISTVPLHELAERIDDRVDVVAVSVVQSATGEVAALDEIEAAARAAGALFVVDATQACGWFPVRSGTFDALVCGGYKWLMAPRGTAWLYLAESLRDRVAPLHAGWYAGESVHDSYYGLPARLATTARRFDTSPAWFSWVGAAPALELVEGIGVERIHGHDVTLANRFRAGLGLAPSNSAIVAASVPGAQEKLERAGIRAATRAGSLRTSFHVYNNEADVDAALEALS